MFKTLTKNFGKDTDYPERQFTIAMRTNVLEGKIYDKLPHPFHEEKEVGGKYIPLRDRRPSVRYGLCKLVVDDSVSLLFSEGHFPEVDIKDEVTKKQLTALIKETSLNLCMIEAATRGSVGSVAIFFRVLKGRVFFEVSETSFLTPTWDPSAPDTLLTVREKYKTKGAALREIGYTIKDADLVKEFWYQREWTAGDELCYNPWLVSEKTKTPTVDKKRSVHHNLGFVPCKWIKNLPGGDKIDGACTFPDEAIDTSIEIDYQLSQAGRGLKYSSDPTLLIKEPAGGENGEIVKSAGNAIVVDKDGDAKMLEINGTAVEAVMNYVRMLRELTLETMHGNRTSADKISAAQSGKAMELMNQALIWLADRLRISYGEDGLLSLLNMIIAASHKVTLVDAQGKKIAPLNNIETLSFRWAAWYQPTADDQQKNANTLSSLTKSGVLSKENGDQVYFSGI